jgi:hypothetical protein
MDEPTLSDQLDARLQLGRRYYIQLEGEQRMRHVVLVGKLQDVFGRRSAQVRDVYQPERTETFRYSQLVGLQAAA